MTAVRQEPGTVTAVPLSPVSLRNALSACLLTVDRRSAKEALPVLTAVHVAKTADQLVFRSTDRYRLTTVTIKLDSPPDGDWETLIPAADVKRAVSALPKTTRDAVIATIGPDAIDLLPGLLRFAPRDAAFPHTAHAVPAQTVPVEEIALDPNSLAVLARMPGRAPNEPARLQFSGPNKPVKCEWVDAKDERVSYQCVLMACRIRG